MSIDLSRFSPLVLAGVLLATTVTAKAQTSARPIGVGWQLGDPSGATGKIWLGKRDAVQGVLGWRTAIHEKRTFDGTTYLIKPAAPYLSVDWVHQFARITSANRAVYLSPHIGIGVGLGTLPADTYYDAFGNRYVVEDGSVSASVRVPFGVNLGIPPTNLEFYAELAGEMRLVPSPHANLTLGIGGRYYF